MSQRERTGRRELTAATEGRGPEATERVREASPVLADGVERFIFADVFAEPGLSAREREMITVAVLAALGGADSQLETHLPAAIAHGADPDELVRLCEQLTPYAGFPRALDALRAVRAVLEEHGLPLPMAAREVDVGDHTTRVADAPGEGVPLLLLHPPELDRLAWRDTARALAGRRRALAPDLRGAGAAAGARPADSLDQLTDDVIRIIDGLALGRVDVVSAAGGGLPAVLAVRRPDLVGTVTVVATTSHPLKGPPDVGGLVHWFSPDELAADAWPVRYARDRLARRAPEGWRALAAALEHGEPDPTSFEGRPLHVIREGEMPLLTAPERLAAALAVG
jgi:3-oxoadipate enol-lactonase